MAKMIILMRNIIKFLMSLFKVLTIFHQVWEYFYSPFKMSHEFCVFDQNQILLLFIPSYHFLRNVRWQRHHTVKYVIHVLRFSNEIDIPHDRFLNGQHGGR